MTLYTATFYELMDTDGSGWGYGSTEAIARERAYEHLVDLYSHGGTLEPPWGDDDDEEVQDPATARAWAERRPCIRVAVTFAAGVGIGAHQLGREATPREAGWRIVCGLMDMSGEDTPDAFLLAEVP